MRRTADWERPVCPGSDNPQQKKNRTRRCDAPGIPREPAGKAGSVQVVDHLVNPKVRWSTSLRVYYYSQTTSFLLGSGPLAVYRCVSNPCSFRSAGAASRVEKPAFRRDARNGNGPRSRLCVRQYTQGGKTESTAFTRSCPNRCKSSQLEVRQFVTGSTPRRWPRARARTGGRRESFSPRGSGGPPARGRSSRAATGTAPAPGR